MKALDNDIAGHLCYAKNDPIEFLARCHKYGVTTDELRITHLSDYTLQVELYCMNYNNTQASHITVGVFSNKEFTKALVAFVLPSPAVTPKEA